MNLDTGVFSLICIFLPPDSVNRNKLQRVTLISLRKAFCTTSIANLSYCGLQSVSVCVCVCVCAGKGMSLLVLFVEYVC